MSGDTMRQSISYLAALTLIAVSYRPVISPAAVLESSGALKTRTLRPIDALVDWLEAAYGGPIDSGGPRP
jgi:hypothetical protein